MPRGVWLTAAVWLMSAISGLGQFKDDAPDAGATANTAVEQWRVGMIVTAEGSGFRRVVGTVSVPTDWPEQRVRVVGEDLSRDVSISYQTVEDTARQMVVKIAGLAAGHQSKAVVTFEIRRTLAPAPQETDQLVVPSAKRLDRKMAIYLAPSPYIESSHAEIKQIARDIGADKKTAWGRVEAIYDWVREKVQYQEDRNLTPKGALDTLHDGTGACDEMTSLFIAVCRAAGIPARTVRIPGHCYPEFYLLDGEGRGQWFPCQAAGTRAFGRMPDPRPILQKGDNVPGVDPKTRRKVKHRFLPETLIGLPTAPGGSLKLQLVCEQVKQNEKAPVANEQ